MFCWNNKVHTELVADLLTGGLTEVLVVERIDIERSKSGRRVTGDEVGNV